MFFADHTHVAKFNSKGNKFACDQAGIAFLLHCTVASEKGGRGARAPHFPEKGAEPSHFQASVTSHNFIL